MVEKSVQMSNTKLSVNINKIATIRNARGGDIPNVLQSAIDCQRFGAQGITVHPRPDERHITRKDVYDIKPIITTEFNIEGNPQEKFIDLVLDVVPNQVTLVPDAVDAITSSAGWDTKSNLQFLKNVCKRFKDAGIRVSIFVDPIPEMICYAAECGCDRIELYTEKYAKEYYENRDKAIEPYYIAAQEAVKCSLGINAGHDLNLDNLKFFAQTIDNLLEVSIGHALISDALYLGLENTIGAYLRELA